MSSVEERFWAKVAKGDGCWTWGGARDVRGYGMLYKGKRASGTATFYAAHRLSWELANGRPIPAGLHVLHSCDNPPCVRPDHLRVGTIQDNVADRTERRRGKEQRGVANTNARLTEEQVRRIITELAKLPRRSQAAIAADFGIKQAQVSRIMLRKSWAHLWEE